MKWPFRSKKDETDIRIFRDPRTGELTLRLNGEIGWPSRPGAEPLITVGVSLNTRIPESAARQLRDQIDALLPRKPDKSP